MKRNKPIWKHRKAGTQWRRRQKAGYLYTDYDRCAEPWKLYVPQSLVGADATAFDMTGATPCGVDGAPDDPTFGGGLYRWQLSTGGKTVLVYTSLLGGLSQVATPGDVWYIFTAKGKCTRSKCPLTRYYYSDNGSELPQHRPGYCPLGIPLDAGWKYVGRKTL